MYCDGLSRTEIETHGSGQAPVHRMLQRLTTWQQNRPVHHLSTAASPPSPSSWCSPKLHLDTLTICREQILFSMVIQNRFTWLFSDKTQLCNPKVVLHTFTLSNVHMLLSIIIQIVSVNCAWMQHFCIGWHNKTATSSVWDVVKAAQAHYCDPFTTWRVWNASFGSMKGIWIILTNPEKYSDPYGLV